MPSSSDRKCESQELQQWKQATGYILEELKSQKACLDDHEARMRVFCSPRHGGNDKGLSWIFKGLSLGGIVAVLIAAVTVASIRANDVAHLEQARKHITEFQEWKDQHIKDYTSNLLLLNDLQKDLEHLQGLFEQRSSKDDRLHEVLNKEIGRIQGKLDAQTGHGNP